MLFNTIRSILFYSQFGVLQCRSNPKPILHDREYSLEVSDFVYIMHEGKIKAEGNAGEIGESEIRKIYLGI